MDTLTNNMRSQIRSDTLDRGKSLPRTDTLNVNDIKAARQTESNRLYLQFYTFVKELTQILEGDLRIKLAVPEGNMGVLAEVCNALIEKLVLFSRWTLYSAEQTTSTSRILLEHTFLQAQAAENQIRQIANVVGTLESVVASTQRLNSSLHLNAAIVREQELGFLQQKVLEETSHTLAENVEITEASINDLYTIAQSLYASSVQILQTSKHIDGLIEAAEDWKHSIDGLHLPEEEPEEAGAEWLL